MNGGATLLLPKQGTYQEVFNITIVGDKVFFTATDGQKGYELWIVRQGSNLRTLLGSDPGVAPTVRIVDDTGAIVHSFLGYDTSFAGGVRVARGDINGDGHDDIIAGAGAGAPQPVKVFSGVDGALIASFSPYGPAYANGVYVAAADVNADGRDDIVVSPDAGGGSAVRVFSGIDLVMIREIVGFANAGGLRAAAGDVNGDGFADIIVGAGANSSHVAVYSGANGSTLSEFEAFVAANPGGVFVAVGDFNGDGKAEIIAGTGAGVPARVRVFDGATTTPTSGGNVLFDQQVFDGSPIGGTWVAATDYNGDGVPELVFGTGPGAQPKVGRFTYNHNGQVFDSYHEFLIAIGGGE